MSKEQIKPMTEPHNQMHAVVLENALFEIERVKRSLVETGREEIPVYDDKGNELGDSTFFLKIAKGLARGCYSELRVDGFIKAAQEIVERSERPKRRP